MRRIAALCLGGLLVLAGCPSQQSDVPSVVTILAAGTYTGAVTCTSKATGKTDVQNESNVQVDVSDTGQLYVSGLPYYNGVQQDMSDPDHGITGGMTINSVVENAAAGTIDIAGTGTLSDSQTTYSTRHDIDLVKTSDTQLQITDVYTGESAAVSKTFELSCSGTITKQ